jgi:hypothetical protein
MDLKMADEREDTKSKSPPPMKNPNQRVFKVTDAKKLDQKVSHTND